jgi:hypothetical protein
MATHTHTGERKTMIFMCHCMKHPCSCTFLSLYLMCLFIVIDSQSQALIAPPTTISQLAGSNNSTNLTPLEWPWEEGLTENGERYYINHVTRTTRWRDPRLCTSFKRICRQSRDHDHDHFRIIMSRLFLENACDCSTHTHTKLLSTE